MSQLTSVNNIMDISIKGNKFSVWITDFDKKFKKMNGSYDYMSYLLKLKNPTSFFMIYGRIGKDAGNKFLNNLLTPTINSITNIDKNSQTGGCLGNIETCVILLMFSLFLGSCMLNPSDLKDIMTLIDAVIYKISGKVANVFEISYFMENIALFGGGAILGLYLLHLYFQNIKNVKIESYLLENENVYMYISTLKNLNKITSITTTNGEELWTTIDCNNDLITYYKLCNEPNNPNNPKNINYDALKILIQYKQREMLTIRDQIDNYDNNAVAIASFPSSSSTSIGKLAMIDDAPATSSDANSITADARYYDAVATAKKLKENEMDELRASIGSNSNSITNQKDRAAIDARYDAAVAKADDRYNNDMAFDMAAASISDSYHASIASFDNAYKEKQKADNDNKWWGWRWLPFSMSREKDTKPLLLENKKKDTTAEQLLLEETLKNDLKLQLEASRERYNIALDYLKKYYDFRKEKWRRKGIRWDLAADLLSENIKKMENYRDKTNVLAEDDPANEALELIKLTIIEYFLDAYTRTGFTHICLFENKSNDGIHVLFKDKNEEYHITKNPNLTFSNERGFKFERYKDYSFKYNTEKCFMINENNLKIVYDIFRYNNQQPTFLLSFDHIGDYEYKNYARFLYNSIPSSTSFGGYKKNSSKNSKKRLTKNKKTIKQNISLYKK